MKKQKKEKVVIPLKRVVHAHNFRKRERGIMMTHRFKNPRSQKDDTLSLRSVTRHESRGGTAGVLDRKDSKLAQALARKHLR